MTKFYLASSLKNKNAVREVSNHLSMKGFTQTYDWTQNERVETLEDLKRIGEKELSAVLEADFIIVMLPAGKGSHIEFGVALGQGKKIYLYADNDEMNNVETTSTFYHLNNVEKIVGSKEELVERVALHKGCFRKLCCYCV